MKQFWTVRGAIRPVKVLDHTDKICKHAREKFTKSSIRKYEAANSFNNKIWTT